MTSSITVPDLQAAILGPQPPLVIDVRKQPTFMAATDMIAGALRRDPVHVATWAKELPSASSVVVYCVHGHEVSQGAAQALRTAGIAARYLADGIEDESRAVIERDLRGDPGVASVDFVSKDAALKRFRDTFPDLAQTLGTLDPNPLPASLDVRLRPTAAARASVGPLVARMRVIEGVSDVRFDQDWLDRLLRGVRLLRLIGFALGGALIVAAALTIANVVRLALNARRDELDIMQLVGAPQSYVRGPFIMEGALHGGVGALVALLALALAFFAGRARFLAPLAAALHLSSVHFLSPLLSLLLVGGGLAVGCLAGLVASRRA